MSTNSFGNKFVMSPCEKSHKIHRILLYPLPLGHHCDGRQRPRRPRYPDRRGGGPQPRRDLGIPLLQGWGPARQEIHKVGRVMHHVIPFHVSFDNH